jgi:hypothetical protein
VQIDVGRLVRRATQPLADQVADLSARLAVAEETVEAQKTLIAELQAPEAEEPAP